MVQFTCADVGASFGKLIMEKFLDVALAVVIGLGLAALALNFFGVLYA